MISYADLLSQPAPALDDRARAALVRDMTDQAWDLAGIVEDLLTVAHTEIGDLKVVKVPVNLTANTAQIIESMGNRGSRVMVTGDRSITGVGDPARFRQIVRNLLVNALTHGSEPITIDVSVSETYTVLAVKDRGPGVPAHLEAEILSRSVENDDPSDPHRTGIGLWISRELPHLMGGHITYQRQAGLTVFQVAIPLQERP